MRVCFVESEFSCQTSRFLLSVLDFGFRFDLKRFRCCPILNSSQLLLSTFSRLLISVLGFEFSESQISDLDFGFGSQVSDLGSGFRILRSQISVLGFGDLGFLSFPKFELFAI